MIVLKPITTLSKKSAFVVKWFIYTWISLSLVSIAVSLVIKFTFQKLPLGLCLPFVDPTNSLIIFKLITWTTALLQIIASCSIIIMYAQLIRSQRKSKEILNISKIKSDTNMIIQIIIITSSNILCWIPSSAIYLSSLFMSQYPTAMVVWTTVAVMPLNSIINPIVFLVCKFKK